jgi:tetratricopeptide (TPR) repeat protein
MINRSTVLKAMGEILAASEVQSEIYANLRHLDVTVGFERPLAGSYLRLARYEEALQLLRDGEPETRRSADPAALAENLMLQGRVLMHLGEQSRSMELLDQAEGMLQMDPKRNGLLLKILDFARCQLALRRGDREQGRRLNTQLMQSLAKPPGNRSVLRLQVLRVASELAIGDGDAKLAREHAEEAVRLAESLARDPSRSGDVGQALLLRARALQALNESSLAAADLQRAVTALSRGLGAEHPDTVAARALL